jgi:murein DD-endopeptidase MepM/ murein hydrolase activator NlpD
MNLRFWLPVLYFGLWMGIAPSIAADPPQPPSCRQSALDRLQRHTISPGETLASLARQYDLLEATLMGLNPVLRNGTAPIGTEILIPPYNGIRVEVAEGTTWQDLADRYNVRADSLFEVNGCKPYPTVVFIPGANWSPGEFTDSNPEGQSVQILAIYPLPSESRALVGYGWVLTPRSSEVVFHSGVDLSASVGTSVKAAGAGTVAFAGEQGIYGNLVVINHQQGRQTRYAHLDQIDVRVGQQVEAGTQLGTVGQTGTPDTDEPHLHFEVRYNSDLGWVAEDPAVYWRSMSAAQR